MADDQDKKVVVPSTADSTIKPSDVTRIAPAAQSAAEPKKLKTIKLKPLKTVAPAPPSDQEETISMQREDLSQKPETPLADEDATVGINRTGTQTTPPPPPPTEEKTSDSSSPEDDATVKIEKVSKQQTPTPPSTPAIPGVKQTIKLRPSSSVADDATAPVASQKAASKQTLKLTPSQQPSTTDEEPAQSAQSPAQPSQEESPKRTIKLVSKKPSAPTVKLDSPASAPTVQTLSEDAQGTPASSKRTLKLKPTAAPPPPAPASSDMGMATEHGAPPVTEPPQMTSAPYQQIQGQKQEDDGVSAVTTIAASISLIALAYFAYQLFSQYKALFM